jgi:hypothetical protein
MKYIDAMVEELPVIVAKTIHNWPAGYQTKNYWKYEAGRLLKKGVKPTVVEIEDRKIPVYHISQTRMSLREKSDFEQAKHEFLRRFWLYARHDRYLLCDEGTSTIDYNAQQAKGNDVPWYSEALVIQHLQGESVYGLFAQESYPRRPARTYWVAADLDLHLATGGNLELFREQVRVIVRHLWGRFGSQIVISETQANGLHLYLFFKRPQDVDRARDALRSTLQRIQRAYPELERKIDEWNETLRHAGKTWKVKQIGDLEIYPDQAHGFRFIGTKGKVVLADQEIGTVQWGTYSRGKKKGVAKHGFDLVAWWKSIQSRERMTKEEVLQIIESRLPPQQPVLEPSDGVVRDHQEPAMPDGSERKSHSMNAADSDASSDPPKRRSSGGLYRRTRRRLTHYWLGIDNPPCWFEKAVIVTARLFAKEGLNEDEAISLLKQYAREIPEETRGCSSRLSKGDWASIDQDISRAVKNAYCGNRRQGDVERSDHELTKTIAAWSKYGFKLSDKTTWEHDAGTDTKVAIAWTEEDRRDISLWLMPALKIEDPDLAARVATGIVELTTKKQAENRGWGYAYLKTWLPDNFGIPCGKQAKQATVFKALVDLGIIRALSKGKKGQATRWAHGSRVIARLDGDESLDYADPMAQKTENPNWMIEESWTWSSWDDLAGEGGEESKGSTSLCSLINTSSG